MEIESGEWHNSVHSKCEESGLDWFRRKTSAPENPEPILAESAKSEGGYGTYLFELKAQPGGREGRPLTTAQKS